MYAVRLAIEKRLVKSKRSKKVVGGGGGCGTGCAYSQRSEYFARMYRIILFLFCVDIFYFVGTLCRDIIFCAILDTGTNCICYFSRC